MDTITPGYTGFGFFAMLNKTNFQRLISNLSGDKPSGILSTGGLLAGSLAIMTDAAHMLSDFASFLISLFAIWVARWLPDKRKTFGYYRAGK